MKAKVFQFIKTYWMMIWIAVAVCALFTMSAYAAYTKTNKAKRVAATYDDIGARFSSNFMDEQSSAGETDISRKPIYISSDYSATTRSVEVTICNYARGVPSYPYDRQIKYILTAKPVYVDTDGIIRDATIADMENTVDGDRIVKGIDISIKGRSTSFNNTNVTPFTYNGTLNRGTANNDTCTVTFNQAFIDEAKNKSVNGEKIYLYLKAEPDGEEFSDLNTLSCLMYVTLDETVERGHWFGNWTDSGANVAEGDATGFDGYNYVIEGVGSGTGYISWNPTYLDLNEDSKRILGITATTPTPVQHNGETWSQYAISLDSSVIGRYDIQFYQVYTVTDRSAYSVWGTITNKVQFDPPAS